MGNINNKKSEKKKYCIAVHNRNTGEFLGYVKAITKGKMMNPISFTKDILVAKKMENVDNVHSDIDFVQRYFDNLDSNIVGTYVPFGFTIKHIMFNQVGDYNIPYLIGVIVESNGSDIRYFFDAFNTDRLLRLRLGVPMLPNRADVILNDIDAKLFNYKLRQLNSIIYNNEEQLRYQIENKFKCKYLKRNEVDSGKVNKIISNITNLPNAIELRKLIN